MILFPEIDPRWMKLIVLLLLAMVGLYCAVDGQLAFTVVCLCVMLITILRKVEEE